MASCVAQTLPHPPRPHFHHRLSSSSSATSLGKTPTVHTTKLNVTSASSTISTAAFGTGDSHEEEDDHPRDTPLNYHEGLHSGLKGHLTTVSTATSVVDLGLSAQTITNNSTNNMDRGMASMTTLTSVTTTTIWSLPPECLSMIVRFVAVQGVQDLFSLLCVNKAFFHLVVPVLYREPFRVAALLVWKQTGYRGMIERQTRLIRTLLHCCTRAVEKPLICQPSLSPSSSKPTTARTTTASSSSTSLPSCATLASAASTSILPTRVGVQPPQQQQQQQHRRYYGIRRIHPKRSPLPAQYQTHTLAEPQSPQTRRPLIASFLGSTSLSAAATNTSTMGQSSHAGVAPSLPESAYPSVSSSSSHSPSSSSSSSSSAGLMISPSAVNPSKRYSFSLILGRNKGSNNSKAQATTALTFSPMSTTSSPSNSTSTSPGPLLKPRKRKVEMIPVIWNEEKQHPETAIIPGLEHQRSIPPDLARTVMELRHDPPPMTNYLAHVTHTDVRSWSAALNLPFVDQILGPKYTWRTKLVKFLKDVPSMATGGVFGSRTEGGHENNGEGWAHMRRRRRHRGRAKGVWGYHDVDFLELLLLYYTSPNIESLSLGIVCSRNYFTMEEMPSPRIHERLSRLRRIEIDHVEALALYASAPLRFIQRHQQMFPGQLREIQIRQSYYYSYDMSKAVLDIIHAMDRIEVLDLSVWMGTFSGFETIRTEHLRKLLISHHIDVTDQHMFDQLLEKCPVLEELSIVVTHPDMFLWAVKRKHEEDKKRIQQITTRRHCTAEFCHGDGREAQRNNTRRKNSDSVLGRRGNLRPRLLPPLKNVVFSGPTMDVVSALKHVFFAFRETLESVHVNMHPDASLQLYMHNVDPSFEHLSSASSSSVPTVSPFNTVDAIPLQAATAAAALSSGTGGLPSNFPYPIEIYNHQHHQQTHQQQHLPLHSQQSSLDDPMASSSSLLPWTPHGSSAHHWAHSHHQQLPNAHGFGHGYESLSTSGPSLTPLWALRHRHFLSESRLTPMLGGIGMAVEADGRMRRGRNGGISHSRRRKATSPSGGEDDDEDDEEEGSSRGVGGKSSKLEDGEDDTGEYDDGDEEEETFFPTFEQVACPSPYCLSWSWILPNLRTLSIRGPLATQFSMHLTQFCPRLEAVHISSSHGYVVRHQPFF